MENIVKNSFKFEGEKLVKECYDELESKPLVRVVYTVKKGNGKVQYALVRMDKGETIDDLKKWCADNNYKFQNVEYAKILSKTIPDKEYGCNIMNIFEAIDGTVYNNVMFEIRHIKDELDETTNIVINKIEDLSKWQEDRKKYIENKKSNK